MYLVIQQGFCTSDRPDMQVSVVKLPEGTDYVQALKNAAFDIAITGYSMNWYITGEAIRINKWTLKNGKGTNYEWAYTVYLDPAENVRVVKDYNNRYHAVTNKGTFLMIDQGFTSTDNFVHACNNGVGLSGEISETDESLV